MIASVSTLVNVKIMVYTKVTYGEFIKMNCKLMF